MKLAAIIVITVFNVLLLTGSIVCAVMTCRNNKIINSIEQTCDYREDSGGVVLTLPRGEELTLQFGNDSVKIVHSFEYNDAETIYKTVMFVREYARENGIEIPRSINEMYGEIRLHNMLYTLGYKREQTVDCDLDYIADRRWYVNIASKLIGWSGL